MSDGCISFISFSSNNSYSPPSMSHKIKELLNVVDFYKTSFDGFVMNFN